MSEEVSEGKVIQRGLRMAALSFVLSPRRRALARASTREQKPRAFSLKAASREQHLRGKPDWHRPPALSSQVPTTTGPKPVDFNISHFPRLLSTSHWLPLFHSYASIKTIARMALLLLDILPSRPFNRITLLLLVA